MLVNLKEILAMADQQKCAVGAFNTPNLECVNAVIAAAEKLNVPVIISHAELHEEVSPLAKIGPVMVQAAKNAKVPVCVHLDHCETLSYIQHRRHIRIWRYTIHWLLWSRWCTHLALNLCP